MNFTNYNDYVSYNMRTYFAREPKPNIHQCPMCASTMSRSESSPSKPVQENIDDLDLIPVHNFSFLFLCEQCDWWCVREGWTLCEYDLELDYLITGVAKKWNLSDKNIPISILHEYFQSKKSSFEFKMLDANVFENLIAECLRYEYMPCEVHHVGARGGKGDSGIDLYLIKDDTGWLIQVKRRLTNQPEPIETIRLLNGVLLRDGKHHGMVVTSANNFTKNAESEATISTPGAYVIKLVDRGDILSMLSRIPRKEEPWRIALKDAQVYKDGLTLSSEFGSMFLK